ncbi:hypothetical protein K461DRAFT_292995 [Myriangium duriaei CBS 260.36]|uniref:A-kinase anchor protein 7-like phosphoesterase domain-containing protein n=1 Tax=Myriangium duriaei CBS 260.36 TaxID=1168546 RepID=A0A9P4J8F2_9PEZI|nr:hypothetical protein K461DRAFT_292995 [Myriangium duriaei CBS 260.36]
MSTSDDVPADRTAEMVEVFDKSNNSKQGQGKPKKPPLTHFLCLPLVTPQSRPELDRNLQDFRNVVVFDKSASSTQDTQGAVPILPAKAVRPVGAIHLTLGVMSLSTTQLEQAKSDLTSLNLSKLLSSATSNPADPPTTSSPPLATLQRPVSPPPTSPTPIPPPLKVSLTSLHSMQSPRHTSILYASPHDPTSRLLPFALSIRSSFTEKGHLVPDSRPLKLHATIVNTIYVRGRDRTDYHSRQDEDNGEMGSGKGKGRRKKRSAPLKFDAKALIERYEGVEWAKDILLDRVAICEMGAKEVRDEQGRVVDAVYTEVASVAIPS